MKPLDHAIVADENIGPEVVAGLRTRGCDVRTAHEEGLIGQSDRAVLECAVSQGRIVVTHDVAFGRSAIHPQRRSSASSTSGPGTSRLRSFLTSSTSCVNQALTFSRRS